MVHRAGDSTLKPSPTFRTLISEEQLLARIHELGVQISRDYAGKRPLLVSVLKGGYIFLADLSRAISENHEVDFMAVSSYAGGTSSTGSVRILNDLSQSIKGRHVLLIEDIYDTGLTLRYLRNHLELREPASLAICTLLRKIRPQHAGVVLEYVGFDIPDEFVVGYGLDYDEIYRNLKDISILELPPDQE
jgi:hypoxanthine phosphoribosyltransferase